MSQVKTAGTGLAFASLEEAKAKQSSMNADPVNKKKRIVFVGKVEGKEPVYIVAQNLARARSLFAAIIGLDVTTAEKAPRAAPAQKSLADQITSMSPDELTRVKAMLDQLAKAATIPAATIPIATPIPAEEQVPDAEVVEAQKAANKPKKGKHNH